MHRAPGQPRSKLTAAEVRPVGVYDGSRELVVKIRLTFGLKMVLWALMSYHDRPSPFLCSSAVAFLYMVVFV